MWVLVIEAMEMGHQCVVQYLAKKKPDRLLGYIKKSATSTSRDIILSLYRELVRSRLDYAVLVPVIRESSAHGY